MPKRHKIKITSDDEARAADAPPNACGKGTTGQTAAETQQRAETFNLEQRVSEAERRAEEVNEKYLRALADLENYRRRARKERAEAARSGEATILLEVLPVLDNFNRAMEAAEGSTDVEALIKGIKMIHDQLFEALARKGVRPIQAEGEPFDPAYHDAVGKIETSDRPEGSVAVEIQKGYMLGDRVLRPSRVMVAARPASEGGLAEGSAREES
jgi:molecular chaperone GrpE